MNPEICKERQILRHDECDSSHFIVSEEIKEYLRSNSFYPKLNI